MHSVSRVSASSDVAAARARVAVAGATGYTGQELLRLLSRHPLVALGAAMSSGQTGASSRRLPGLTRLWDGVITPLSADTLATDADVVFLALPDSAPRSSRRPSWTPACASSISPAPSAAAGRRPRAVVSGNCGVHDDSVSGRKGPRWQARKGGSCGWVSTRGGHELRTRDRAPFALRQAEGDAAGSRWVSGYHRARRLPAAGGRRRRDR